MGSTKEKKTFPKWLCKWDPILESAEYNNLFQLFAMRRNEHGPRGPFIILSRWWKRINLRSLLWGLLAVFILTVFTYYLWCLGWILAFGLISTFNLIRRQHHITDKRLPFSVCDVFINDGIVKPVVIDLWLSGVCGREVIGAIYLEKRQKTGLALIFIPAIFSLTLAGLYFWFRGPLSVVKILTMISFLWLSLEIIKRYVIHSPKKITKNLLEPMLYQWSNTTKNHGYRLAFAQGSYMGLLKLLAFATTLIIMAIILTMVLNGIDLKASQAPGITGYIFPNSGYLIDFVGCITFLFTAINLLIFHEYVKKNNLKEYYYLLDQFNMAFSLFMTHHVIQDIDGSAWVRKYYKWQPHKGEYKKLEPTVNIYYWAISPDLTKLLIHQEVYEPKALSSSWIEWDKLTISVLLMREINEFLQWHEKLDLQDAKSRDAFELNKFYAREKELLDKLRSHLGTHYKIIFRKSILKSEA